MRGPSHVGLAPCVAVMLAASVGGAVTILIGVLPFASFA